MDAHANRHASPKRTLAGPCTRSARPSRPSRYAATLTPRHPGGKSTLAPAAASVQRSSRRLPSPRLAPAAPPAPGAKPAVVSIQDDEGRAVTLPHPAARAISLAPHVTELVYAAGAGDRLAGAARGSDYRAPGPQAAVHRRRPVARSERGPRWGPDLVIGWAAGRRRPAASSCARWTSWCTTAIRARCATSPTPSIAWACCSARRPPPRPPRPRCAARIDALAARYAGRAPVRVFIQAGREPVYTLNGTSIVSDALRVCGGINGLADAAVTAPQVTQEAALAAQPDVIVAGMADPASLQATTAAWRALRLAGGAGGPGGRHRRRRAVSARPSAGRRRRKAVRGPGPGARHRRTASAALNRAAAPRGRRSTRAGHRVSRRLLRRPALS